MANTEELEKRVVSAFVKDKQYLTYALTLKYKAEFFETEHARTIFAILEQYSETTLGFAALNLIVDSQEGEDNTEIRNYIKEIAKIEIDDSPEFEIEWLRKEIAKKKTIQGFNEGFQDIMTRGDPTAAFNIMAARYFETADDFTEPDDLEAGLVARSKERQAKLDDKSYVTIPTQWMSLDIGLDGGMRTTEMIWIAGFPGVGKSYAADCIGLNGFFGGFDVLKISTENTREQSIARTESSYYGVNYRQLQNCDPAIDIAALDARDKRANRHFTIRIFPDEDTALDVVRKISYLKLQYGFDPALIILDSPDFLALPKADSSIQYGHHNLMTKNILVLKKFIEQERKVLVCTSHVKLGDYKGRRGERNDRLDLGDLSDTSGKVRLADVVITLNQNEELADTGRIEAFVCKNRDTDAKPFGVVLKRDFHSPRLIEDMSYTFKSEEGADG